MQPQENPARVLLGLHGNSTERFFLKNIECSSMLDRRLWDYKLVSDVGSALLSFIPVLVWDTVHAAASSDSSDLLIREQRVWHEGSATQAGSRPAWNCQWPSILDPQPAQHTMLGHSGKIFRGWRNFLQCWAVFLIMCAVEKQNEYHPNSCSVWQTTYDILHILWH